MSGPLMYAVSQDPVSAAKVLASFAKTNDKLVITGGALPDNALDSAGVQALATMPSREELLAKPMGTMQAPVTQRVRTLNDVPTNVVRGLADERDQKEAAEAIAGLVERQSDTQPWHLYLFGVLKMALSNADIRDAAGILPALQLPELLTDMEE